MDIKEIDKLIKLVEKSGISKLFLEENGVKIEIKKEQAVTNFVQHIPSHSIPVHHSPQNSQPAVEAKIDAVVAKAPSLEKDDSLVEILSPMVGTCYTAASPDTPAFIKVGQKVNKGDTLFIVEAMKLFNEIEAEVSGTVESILANNAQPVDFGQPLCVIRKSI